MAGKFGQSLQPIGNWVPTRSVQVHHPSLATLRRASFGWQANLPSGSARRTSTHSELKMSGLAKDVHRSAQREGGLLASQPMRCAPTPSS